MNLDITFCTKKDCKNSKCERRKPPEGWQKYKPYLSFASFDDCKEYKNGKLKEE